eukprot:186132_1
MAMPFRWLLLAVCLSWFTVQASESANAPTFETTTFTITKTPDVRCEQKSGSLPNGCSLPEFTSDGLEKFKACVRALPVLRMPSGSSLKTGVLGGNAGFSLEFTSPDASESGVDHQSNFMSNLQAILDHSLSLLDKNGRPCFTVGVDSKGSKSKKSDGKSPSASFPTKCEDLQSAASKVHAHKKYDSSPDAAE